MLVHTLLADPEAIRLICIRPSHSAVILVVKSTALQAMCPVLGRLLADFGAVRPGARRIALARRDVLNWIKTDELKLRIEKTFPLSEAAEAHRELEGRATTGKILLLP